MLFWQQGWKQAKTSFRGHVMFGCLGSNGIERPFHSTCEAFWLRGEIRFMARRMMCKRVNLSVGYGAVLASQIDFLLKRCFKSFRKHPKLVEKLPKKTFKMLSKPLKTFTKTYQNHLFFGTLGLQPSSAPSLLDQREPPRSPWRKSLSKVVPLKQLSLAMRRSPTVLRRPKTLRVPFWGW